MDEKVVHHLLSHYKSMLEERIIYLENQSYDMELTTPDIVSKMEKIQEEIFDCRIKLYTTIAHIQILERG